MNLFYAPDIAVNEELPEEEAHHCIHVLRMGQGDKIKATDGQGNFYLAEIVENSVKHCRLKILEKNPVPVAWEGNIEIAVSPTKNMDRMEWFVEKATEIGIDKIHFLLCRNSERREIKPDRIEKVLIASMKQSLKAVLPVVEEMVRFEEFMDKNFEGKKFIAHCYEDSGKVFFSNACKKGENTLVLIGPEGDFTEEEVRLALKKGFVPVSLGESRLRTETAALVACHTFHVVNQIVS